MFMKHSWQMKAALLFLGAALSTAAAADNPYLGSWMLTIPGGGAGWLGVEEADGGLKASLLWGGGSVLPLASAKVEDGKLIVTRKQERRQREGGREVRKTILETITATADGDALQLEIATPRDNGQGDSTKRFRADGRRPCRRRQTWRA